MAKNRLNTLQIFKFQLILHNKPLVKAPGQVEV